ncbi:kynureninase [Dimargaris cristalligena]|uniref:Kynureninase n=1 Tax=Dimargaris cristalligena TaxID=215637 RepID=A0A4Q0A376_9FUNG|nr:kynureninase [Dimargaris cristalligena]|eukprot:RKP40041.1 kynureninase [Dimargaris cristalligena]
MPSPADQLEALAQSTNLDPLGSAFAEALDAQDPLRHFRDEFCYPTRAEDTTEDQLCTYLCGNSLGLQPKATKQYLLEELEIWAKRGVLGHHSHAYQRPWLTSDENVLQESARIVGCKLSEVAILNTLTVNIHFLFAAFYQPTPQRFKVIMEAKAFPSDRYAVESQIRWHGLDPAEALVTLAPREGEHCLRTEDILEAIEKEGSQTALVFFSGIQYYTGQLFDMKRITEAGHAQGSLVGFDLAHAVGNVPLYLHDWAVDFACWCTYKYLNSGPGGIAGIYVHEKYAQPDEERPRLAGWWSNQKATRFQMRDQLDPIQETAGYQVSNPNVFAMTSLLASLTVFGRTDMAALRRKSILLTGYLEYQLTRRPRLSGKGEGKSGGITIMTPSDPEARGCQLSLLLPAAAFRPVFAGLSEAGIVCDEREPNCIRVGPTPLYNSFQDVYRFVQVLDDLMAGQAA